MPTPPVKASLTPEIYSKGFEFLVEFIAGRQNATRTADICRPDFFNYIHLIY
jgi:hypothetical protein